VKDIERERWIDTDTDVYRCIRLHNRVNPIYMYIYMYIYIYIYMYDCTNRLAANRVVLLWWRR